MAYVPYKKGTLLIPSGPQGNHLFAILTDVNADGEHLLVSVTSIKENQKYDVTCTLTAGEHPFIKHPSFALYRLADVQKAEKLVRMVEGWVYRPHQDISDDLLARLSEGVVKSPFTPRRIITFLKQNGG